MSPTLFSQSMDGQVSSVSHQGAPDEPGNASDWFTRCLEGEDSVSEQVSQLERRLARLGGHTPPSGQSPTCWLTSAADCLPPTVTTVWAGGGVVLGGAMPETHVQASASTACTTAAALGGVFDTVTSTQTTPICFETMPIPNETTPTPTQAKPVCNEVTPSTVFATPSMAVNVNVESICRPGFVTPVNGTTGAILKSFVSPKSTQTTAVQKSDVGTLTPPGERFGNERKLPVTDQSMLLSSIGEVFNQPCSAQLMQNSGKDISAELALAVDSCSSVYQQIMQSLGMPMHDDAAGDVAMGTEIKTSSCQHGVGRKEPVKPAASFRRAVRPGTSTSTPSKPAAKPAPSEQKPRDRPPTNQKAAGTDVTQRYLSFIDELIHEKKELATRCEQLASQTSSVESNYLQQINSLKEKHKQQILALKRSLSETEKSKRQKWMESEREKIKESTARGMQSQIEQMMKQHAEEMSRLREMYETRLTASNNSPAVSQFPFGGVSAGNDQHLRARLLLEKDEALQQAQLRHERQLNDMSRDQESAVSGMNQEIVQLQNQLKSAQQQANTERQQSQAELERKLTELRNQLTAQAKSDSLQLQTELQEKERVLRESMRAELEDALSQQREQLQQAADERLGSELRRVREERDVRVEEVIVRLEQEMRRTEDTEARRYSEKLRVLEEKHAVDLRALETSEERYKSRYLDCRGRLAEREEELLELKSRLNRKDSEIGEMKQTAEMLQHEQQQLGDVIEAEFRSQLSELRQSTARWQQRLREEEVQHAAELNAVKHKLECVQQKRQSELEALHKQIKQAFSVKEQSIAELQCSLQHSQRKVLQLERLIDKMQQGGCHSPTHRED